MSDQAFVPPIALTMGDAAGIGPELCAHLLTTEQKAPVVVYGDIPAMQRALALIGKEADYQLAPSATPRHIPRPRWPRPKIPMCQSARPCLPIRLTGSLIRGAAKWPSNPLAN